MSIEVSDVRCVLRQERDESLAAWAVRAENTGDRRATVELSLYLYTADGTIVHRDDRELSLPAGDCKFEVWVARGIARETGARVAHWKVVAEGTGLQLAPQPLSVTMLQGERLAPSPWPVAIEA